MDKKGWVILGGVAFLLLVTIAIVVVATSSSASSSAKSGCVEWQQGYLPKGNDVPGYEGFNSTGPEDCSIKCGSVRDCVAWTLLLESNLCWLKNTEMDAEMNDDDDDKFLWGMPCAITAPCCSTCTCENLAQCSTNFTSTPPFQGGTTTLAPDTITDTDPTEFVSLSEASEGVLESMYGPNGWDYEVPVWDFTAQFKDSPDVWISFDKDVGDATFCAQLASIFSQAAGRTPAYARTDFVGLDIRPGGSFGAEGCEAWGGGGLITMCLGVGQELIDTGSIEELFLRHGSLDSVHSLLEGTDAWLCARQRDKNFISTFAADFPTENDVAESMVPWYAHTYSSTRVPMETITAIEEAIPARLEVISSLLGNVTVRQMWAENSKNTVGRRRPDATTTPRIISPHL